MGEPEKKTETTEKPGEKRTVEETRTPGTPEKIERKETVDHPPQPQK